MPKNIPCLLGHRLKGEKSLPFGNSINDSYRPGNLIIENEKRKHFQKDFFRKGISETVITEIAPRNVGSRRLLTPPCIMLTLRESMPHYFPYYSRNSFTTISPISDVEIPDLASSDLIRPERKSEPTAFSIADAAFFSPR